MTDKEKLQKIKSFCREKIDEHSSLFDEVVSNVDDDDDVDKDFFSWTDFDKIINIIDGVKDD